MDLQKIKEEAQKLKTKAQKAWNDLLEFGASKIADSKFTLKDVEAVEAFRKTSKNTQGTDSHTGEKKTFTHRSIVLFADIHSDFFKEMIFILPVLETKSFSQNIKFRLADISMKWLNTSTYEIHKDPSMVVFESEKILKTIEGEENIQKVVKSLSLDINKAIDEL